MSSAAPAGRLLPWALAALGVVLTGSIAWYMHFAAPDPSDPVECELAAVVVRRAAPSGAAVTASRVGGENVLVVNGVTDRAAQDDLLRVLARVQVAEGWDPIRVEFAPAVEASDRAGRDDSPPLPRVETLRAGERLD